ncbi:MAG: amino acid ABC transporter permease [Actinobacteria bacterium]|nr:amino acid ABC transporter permease [Actinomycetota bacterium]
MSASVPSRREVRAAARQRSDRRGALIAAISTLIVIGGGVLWMTTRQGWPAVEETFFSAEAFRTSFPDILRGFWIDVKLFLVVEVLVLVCSLLVAVLRSTRSPALFPFRLIGAVYADLFRGIPTILIIYLVGFGIPALGLPLVPNDPIILAAIALTLSYTAYVSEVFRAGIDSVHPGQRGAALAVGLSRAQAMRFVVLPQAVRNVVPPLLNDFISLQKDVALVSVLGIVEAFRVAQIDAASTFNYTPLLAAASLYVIVTVPLSLFLDRMQRRHRRSRRLEEARA